MAHIPANKPATRRQVHNTKFAVQNSNKRSRDLCQFHSQVHELTLIFGSRQQSLYVTAAPATPTATNSVENSQHQHCQRTGTRQTLRRRVELTNISVQVFVMLTATSSNKYDDGAYIFKQKYLPTSRLHGSCSRRAHIAQYGHVTWKRNRKSR